MCERGALVAHARQLLRPFSRHGERKRSCGHAAKWAASMRACNLACGKTATNAAATSHFTGPISLVRFCNQGTLSRRGGVDTKTEKPGQRLACL